MTKRKPLPSQEVLCHLFRYEPETGKVFWMNPPPHSRAVRGDEITSKTASGYLRVCISKSTYRLQNVIWKMVTGRDPQDGFFIDHEDTDKTNNKWENFREATTSENVANQSLTSRNTSGFKGVSRVPSGKWKASVRYQGVLIYLGHYDTPEEAHAAYVKKAVELFGEYARVK